MAKPERRGAGDSDVHRAKRGKNWAVLAVLVAFIVIVYFVSIIRMSG
jgi:hypothetical protein